jgi:predicted RNase H-like HicB family nuclease
MNTARITEYAVRLSHRAVNGTEIWEASVEKLPEITAEGSTCEEALKEIGQKLQSSLVDGESAATPRPVKDEMTPQELAELEAQVEAMGHKYYGIFADDPDAMEVFDEIERLRNQHTIGR